ncbi:hypothetical protein BDW69DRAFT_178714 [Aspergillus filifer]
MIAALEILHHVTSTRVLSPDNKTLLNPIGYLPILGIIAIAYAFKGIASSLKKITPWADMSGKWTTGSDSVLLDYVDGLKIIAAFTSLERKHWVVTMGLIGALLAGALVPFASSLAYSELFAPRNTTTTFTQSSVFGHQFLTLSLIH